MAFLLNSNRADEVGKGRDATCAGPSPCPESCIAQNREESRWRESKSRMFNGRDEFINRNERACSQRIDCCRPPFTDGRASTDNMPAASGNKGTYKAELVDSPKGKGGGPTSVYWTGAGSSAVPCPELMAVSGGAPA